MASSKGNGSGGGKGIGHSGPRVVVGGGVPNNSQRLGASNSTTRNLGVPSLPGGLGTPPLVKSKLVVLPPGSSSSSSRAGQSQVANLPYSTQQQQAPPMRSSTQQQNRPLSSQQQPLSSTDAPFQLATALAPSSKQGYAHNQNPPLSSTNQTPITPGNTNIPTANINNNVTPGVATPNEVAMSSPMTPSMARSIDNSDNMRHQPHIVNMPPPPPPAASTNQSNASFAHPLENTGQQQQQVYQPYSQQSTASSTGASHPLNTSTQQPQVAVATSKAKAQLDPPTQQQQKKKVSPTKKTSPTKQQQQQRNKQTPEDEVDTFLSGPIALRL